MGFRSDHEALRHRVDALEGQVEERDAEVVRLRAELEAARAKDPGPAKAAISEPGLERTETPAPAADERKDFVDDDTWALPMVPQRERAPLSSLVVLGLGVGAPVMLYEAGYIGLVGTLVGALTFGLGSLGFLIYRGGIVADRRTRAVKIWRSAILGWSRTLAVGEQSIFVEKTTAAEDESKVVGRVYLGEHFLFERPWDDARGLAERLADFLGAPSGGERPHRRRR